MRLFAVVLAGTVVAVSLLGVGDAVAYTGRENALTARWAHMEAEGIPAVEIDPLRAQLADLSGGHFSVVPYAVVSGAAVSNPLAGIEAATDAIWTGHLAAEKSLADAALTDLLAADTFSFSLYAEGHRAVAEANSLVRLRAMRLDWSARAADAATARSELSTAAGGLRDGRPADVAGGLAAVSALTDHLAAAGLSVEPGPGVAATVDSYYWLPLASQKTAHSDLMATLKSTLTTLQGRLDLFHAAQALVKQSHALLQTYLLMGGDVRRPSSELESAEQALGSARTTSDLDLIRTDLQKVASGLARSLHAPFSQITYTACLAGAPSKLIVIHTISEVLVAYTQGCPWFQTLVTTGRPGLRTDLGDFHILAKYSPYLFISPWPPGDPNYYPPTWVTYAMPFVSDGTFIHDSPWQPLGTYGPGSENGWYASHGCIHMQPPVMPALYAWTDVGTEVRTVAD